MHQGRKRAPQSAPRLRGEFWRTIPPNKEAPPTINRNGRVFHLMEARLYRWEPWRGGVGLYCRYAMKRD